MSTDDTVTITSVACVYVDDDDELGEIPIQ